MEEIPEKVLERAEIASGELLPKKSRVQYMKEYEKFKEWQNRNNITAVCETILLGYVQELSESFSPNSLWAKYSMLRSTLLVHEKIDIKQYRRLEAYLKQLSKGYTPKKSKILTREDVLKFIREASDEKYLLEKVVLVMGVFGGLRRQEMVDLTVDDIDDRGAVIVVTIGNTKTGGPKSFTIVEENEMNALSLYRKYASLRPQRIKERRFFLGYRNGRCISQVVGKNTFGSVPSRIAKYLGYADADKYTGHCLRRTSATLLVNAGADMLTLKRHGKWKSDTVAAGYIEDSMASKNKISRLIGGSDNIDKGETSSSAINIASSLKENLDLGNCSFQGSFSNCIFNFKNK